MDKNKQKIRFYAVLPQSSKSLHTKKTNQPFKYGDKLIATCKPFSKVEGEQIRPPQSAFVLRPTVSPLPFARKEVKPFQNGRMSNKLSDQANVQITENSNATKGNNSLKDNALSSKKQLRFILPSHNSPVDSGDEKLSIDGHGKFCERVNNANCKKALNTNNKQTRKFPVVRLFNENNTFNKGFGGAVVRRLPPSKCSLTTDVKAPQSDYLKYLLIRSLCTSPKKSQKYFEKRNTIVRQKSTSLKDKKENSIKSTSVFSNDVGATPVLKVVFSPRNKRSLCHSRLGVSGICALRKSNYFHGSLHFLGSAVEKLDLKMLENFSAPGEKAEAEQL